MRGFRGRQRLEHPDNSACASFLGERTHAWVSFPNTCPGTARDSRDPVQFRDKCVETARPPHREPGTKHARVRQTPLPGGQLSDEAGEDSGGTSST